MRASPSSSPHNAGEVDKNNVQREHIGTILSPGIQDGDDVRAKIVIHNTDAMKRSGMRELSLGYSLDLDERPGTWNGQPLRRDPAQHPHQPPSLWYRTPGREIKHG